MQGQIGENDQRARGYIEKEYQSENRHLLVEVDLSTI